MPYILNKTNGTIVATVQDASLDLTTDLAFVGKNYAGYGETQNENFLKLLENFSNTTPPTKPIDGQLWFDTTNKQLNVYDGDRFHWKTIGNLEIADETVDLKTTKSPNKGDLWFNTTTEQLNVYNGTDYIVVGPPTGSDTKAQWKGDFEYSSVSLNLPVYNIKAVVGSTEEVIAIVSGETITMPDYSLTDTDNPPKYQVRTPAFTQLAKGITLNGAVTTTTNGITYGSSRKEVTGLSEDSYFWGTAGEALHALTANTSSFTSGLSYVSTNTNAKFFIPFVSSGTSQSICYTDAGLQYNPNTNILYTIASSALYADIAERYEADAVYEPGTVLMLGGEKEVTLATLRATTTVAGVVSTKPAYMLNSEAGNDETHPYIALKGRVPTKVCGAIKKGDLLVSSAYKPGFACKMQDGDSPNAVIGKALENFEGPFGVIEVKI